MDTFTVSFFGHRKLNDVCDVEKKLEKKIRNLLLTKEYVEFLIGRDGAFDLLAASTVHRCRRTVRQDNSSLVLVLPYMTAQYQNNQASFHRYYDHIELCAQSSSTYFKSAHQTRNRTMVDRSDLVIFCVQHPSGGAYQTMQYARRTNVQIVNLWDEEP